MEFVAVALWLATVAVVAALAVPIAAWVFPRGDHGAYAVTVAIVILGVIGHLVGHLSYRLPALVAGVAVLVGGALLTWPRVSIRWRDVGVASVVFSVAFLAVVGLRLVEPSAGTNPHWVGEMFLDFGLVSALERAQTLPPEDLWFAGEAVRYHYGGHLLTSLLAGLSGTPPALAYNLGLATFFGALVTMAWGVAGSIARPMAISTRLAAGAGAFFVAVAGNLETALRTLVWLLPRSIGEAVVDVTGVDPDLLTWSPGSFSYYDASRIIEREGMGQAAATEFPLFSWLHGDLHAHVLVKPVILLVVALLVAYWYTPPADRRRRLILLFGAVPPVIGLIAVINMWSVPVVVGLVAVALVFAPGHPLALGGRDWPDRLRGWLLRQISANSAGPAVTATIVSEGTRVGGAVLAAGAVAVVAVAWSLPYWLLVVLGGPSEQLATWPAGTPVGEFLVVMGAFVLGFVVYLGSTVAARREQSTVVMVTLVLAIAVAAALGWLVLGIAVALLAIGWWALRRDVATGGVRDIGPSSVGPETMLIVAGLGIVAIVEVAHLEGDTFNSVFKPYADVWQLWGVALGVVVVRLTGGWPLSTADREASVWAAVCLVIVILLVVSTGLYGAFAVPTHLDEGTSWSSATSEVRAEHGYTLDATAYVDVLYPAEADAISWLDDRKGSPTIVTGVPAGYWWQPDDGEGAAAPASLTGLPTVLGWDAHEWQYRGLSAVEQRRDAVIDIYTGDVETQTTLLERYDVSYVYVGPAERSRWIDITVDSVPGVSVAYEDASVTIYRVE